MMHPVPKSDMSKIDTKPHIRLIVGDWYASYLPKAYVTNYPHDAQYREYCLKAVAYCQYRNTNKESI